MTRGPRQSEATKRALRAIVNGMTVQHAAKKYGLDPSTIYRALKRQEKNKA